ncbi:MAG: cytochrome c biogenesis protein CcsA [Kiloniellales bacterium]|nr:cytochrome c biogenesis protein CcsA [Kiloniellales bacterium]
MANNLLFGFAAMLSLLPASLLSYRRGAGQRDLLFWVVLAAAVVGPVAYALAQVFGPWQTGLSKALWLSIAVSLVLFLILTLATREAWRLTPLLLPYLCGLAVLALVWGQVPAQGELTASLDLWLTVHILVSLATYGLATLAAVAGCAVFLKERDLKRKQSSRIGAMLPSIADGEALELRLLATAELVLGIGVLTGMALEHLSSGQLLVLDHKTLLSLLAFLVIGLLLVLHRWSGLRGKRAARLALLAYLLLTLAYPGVKFVTDILVA